MVPKLRGKVVLDTKSRFAGVYLCSFAGLASDPTLYRLMSGA